MKIYEYHAAPNPRRVRIFLAEKGIDMNYIQVDLKQGEHLKEDFREINPMRGVPVLELESGEHISETMAICRYFEEHNPEPALLGRDPLERARIDMWQRRMELNLFFPVGYAFRNLTDFWADRITPIREWGEVNLRVSQRMMGFLEEHLSKQDYMAGEAFSVADITAYVALDFARYLQVEIDPKLAHLKNWYDRMAARPSAKA